MELYWRLCWQIITPIGIAFITVYYWADHQDDAYLNYVYPSGAQALGWFIELVPLAIVVCFSFVVIWKKVVRGGHGLKYLVTPKPSWGPRADSGLVIVKPNQGGGLENPSFVSP